MAKYLFGLLLLVFYHISFATSPVIAPEPSTCIQATFSNTGTTYWKTINLLLTNNCGQAVDFQNVAITFLNTTNLNTSFWGNFSPLSYPDNRLQIASQPQTNGNFLASFSLHFPTYSGSNSLLPSGQSITIIYGAPSADYIGGSAKVYLNNPPNTGEIDLTNASAKPTNVSQTYALIQLTLNGQKVSDIQLPWLGSVKIPGLVAGTYTLSPVNITGSTGKVYQGTANPATIALSASQIATSTITYKEIPQTGNIAFKVQTLPAELAGYVNNPAITLKNTADGSLTNATLKWSATTTVSQLATGKSYTFSSPTISFNGFNCSPLFNPTAAIANTIAPIVNVTYSCKSIPPAIVNINVNGLTSTTTSVAATFTPNNNSTPISKTVLLTNGQGADTVQLVDGTIYTVTATAVSGFTASYNPQPLTAKASATETITYTKSTPSAARIIGYLPGWKTPPTATALASAGYTHILVAFGVFSTGNPGVITPAFDTITASYIKSLQAAGIKVLLSLGGALTSLPNTTVNFHQVLQMASSPTSFTQTFIQSLESLITQYGFDGFDIDIEHGLTAGGTFTNPQGDIAVLANILNTMHAKHPALLLTLVPQTANISATSTFNETWGNYASLVMQTYNSLAWVGIQLYNTGCMFGIDRICYDPNAIGSPNFSVAMATDLLADWPTNLGFLPYISKLQPSQVVIGYLMPNAQGQGDGSPIIPVPTIKRALQCLRTGIKSSTSCDTYVPPKTYPSIGGVFGWEVTFDQSNSYKFATGLKACVINGVC